MQGVVVLVVSPISFDLSIINLFPIDLANQAARGFGVLGFWGFGDWGIGEYEDWGMRHFNETFW